MNKQDSDYYLAYGITRRRFIGTAAGGSAALLTGGLASLLKSTASAAGFQFLEATIPQLQAAMASGQLTSVQLTTNYLNQIATFNPLLHAVIETNPDALALAKRLDTDPHTGHLRGPLHGFPALV